VYGRGSQISFGPPITPQIIKTLIIVNGVVFIAQNVTPLIDYLGAVKPHDVWGKAMVWQPFTYMWLHGSPLHILFNMFALWMFGSQLALTWGEQRFLRYYLICGVGAGILIATVPYVPVMLGLSSVGPLLIPTLGASGAVMGILLAYSFTWPDRTIQLLIPPVPIKAIWLIPLLFFMEMFSGPSNISHVGHLGGAVVGWAYLVREGRTPGAPTMNTLKFRWKRYRTRQKLRAVHDEARRENSARRRDDDDRTYH
jgi:membrane associated rhomboid family serine protease